jgi:hypothetical protein
MKNSCGDYKNVPNVVRVSNKIKFSRKKAFRYSGNVNTNPSYIRESHKVDVRDGW